MENLHLLLIICYFVLYKPSSGQGEEPNKEAAQQLQDLEPPHQ